MINTNWWAVALLEYKKWNTAINNNERREENTEHIVYDVKDRVCHTIELDEIHPLEQEFIDEMNKEIIWQDEAKKIVAQLIKNSVLWTKPKKWPLGVLFFSGPTWVGKTEIVKCISKVLMWYEGWFTKINCEAYQESHSKRQLFWAPPSYVGYWDPTPLDPKILDWYYEWAKKAWTIHDSIRHMPWFNIILFDEFEKAHRDVAQSLLWILDEWKVTFWDWKTWYFKNSIIIFTSNIWQKEIEETKSKPTMWFVSASEESENKDSSEIIKKAIKERFSPEFRWRVDKFIEFESLTKENALEIIRIQERKLNEHYKRYYKTMDLSISLWENIISSILENWFNQKSWARWLIWSFEKHVENKLIDLFNSERFQEFYHIKAPIEIALDMDWEKTIYNVYVANEFLDEQNESIKWKELVANNHNNLIFNQWINLDKLRWLNELMTEYISIYNLHIDDDDTDFSEDLRQMEKVFTDLWFNSWDIKFLRNCSMVELLSDVTALWRFDFLQEHKDNFYPLTQRVVYRYVEKKVVKYVENNWLKSIKPYDIVDDVWLYFSEKFFDWNNLNTKQIFEIVYFIWKVYAEKYNITIDLDDYVN